MAQSGHSDTLNQCPLLGVKQTCRVRFYGTARPRRLPVTLLICADELCIGQYVALRCSPAPRPVTQIKRLIPASSIAVTSTWVAFEKSRVGSKMISGPAENVI